MRKKLGLTRMEIVTLFLTVLVIIFATLAVSYATGFFDDIVCRFANRNIVEVERDFEEEARIMRLIRKGVYGSQQHFQFQITRDGERRVVTGWSVLNIVDPSFPSWHDPFYTDIVFVHTEAEALDFPDNIIVAWPIDDPFTERTIYHIHQRVNARPEATFEGFGLTYPITVADLVDNWEKVAELMVAIRMIEWWPGE